MEIANIEFLETNNRITFFNLFFEKLPFYKSMEECFNYCNSIYRKNNGDFYCMSYDEFKNKKTTDKVKNKPIPKNSINELEREFLVCWFKSKGFDTWVSFKAIISHYYPIISESNLYNYWNGDVFIIDVQIMVGYVKQIIG